VAAFSVSNNSVQITILFENIKSDTHFNIIKTTHDDEECDLLDCNAIDLDRNPKHF
jgi:hypothetical protein